MDWLSDEIVSHLRNVLDTPDLTATRYELLGEIGSGGMGTVYLARDRELERHVALKVLSADAAREAKVLATLEHPGIVPVHDAGTLPDGRRYYAMKLVEGRRLDEFLLTQPALSERLRVFLRICEPVAFAHSHGFIHRDLKPDNIMLGSFGEVLVLDWGVAARADDAATVVAGTPGYMPPEQAVGPRADIFALGKILTVLFRGEDVPKQIRAIANRASCPEPSQRYANVEGLAADISCYLDGLPVSAYPESMWEQAARWVSRHRTLLSLFGTYILVRAIIFFFTRR